MRDTDIKYHFARYLLSSLILSFITFGWFGCAAVQKPDFSEVSFKHSEKQLTIDRLSGSKDSEYQLDKGKLSEVVNRIEAGEFGKIHSLVIIHNDEVILEKYFLGWHRHRLHQIFSVTKSVTSSLIGIAIEQGLIEGVDLKLIETFPEYDRLENMDPRKKIITLDNLLSMTAGYQWNELSVPYQNSDGSWNPNNDIIKMHMMSKDFIKYVLDLPLVDEPGEKYNYNSGCSILLAGIIKSLFTTGSAGEAGSGVVGPIGIFNFTSQALKIGWIYILQLLAILSINLGIINILPFPALDGGKILFLGLEGIFRKKILRQEIENLIHTIGFILLIILLLAITLRDILRFR